MQIRQLEALQNMARTSGSKTIFGASPSRTFTHQKLIISPNEFGRHGSSRNGRQHCRSNRFFWRSRIRQHWTWSIKDQRSSRSWTSNQRRSNQSNGKHLTEVFDSKNRHVAGGWRNLKGFHMYIIRFISWITILIGSNRIWIGSVGWGWMSRMGLWLYNVLWPNVSISWLNCRLDYSSNTVRIPMPSVLWHRMVWAKLEFGGLIDCIVEPKYKNSGCVILATLLVSVDLNASLAITSILEAAWGPVNLWRYSSP